MELGFVHDNKQENEMRLGYSELKTSMIFEDGDAEGAVGDRRWKRQRRSCEFLFFFLNKRNILKLKKLSDYKWSCARRYEDKTGVNLNGQMNNKEYTKA